MRFGGALQWRIPSRSIGVATLPRIRLDCSRRRSDVLVHAEPLSGS